jgi:hypothetical protein
VTEKADADTIQTDNDPSLPIGFRSGREKTKPTIGGMMNDQTQPEKKETYTFGSLLALGVSFGMIVGLLLDQTGMGLSLGLGLAVLVNAIKEARDGESGAKIAVVISAAALLMVIGLWIWIG